MRRRPGHFIRGFPLQEPAVRLLHELGTRVLVIDELNSLLTGTPRQQRVFPALPRFLSNELRLAFVAVGVPRPAMRCCLTVSSAAASPNRAAAVVAR